MQTLTLKEKQIIDFMKQKISQTGMPPTQAEIARILGFASPAIVSEHLNAMAEKGAIEIIPGSSRGIRVLGDEHSNHSEKKDSSNEQTIAGWPLSPREYELFDLIRTTTAQTGMSPTRGEIARQLGLQSPNIAEDLLQSLARKEIVEILPGTSRGIRLLEHS